MMNKELRAFECEVRAEKNEENGTYLTGRPIVYDARTDLGYYDEIIEAGALNECDLRDVRFLVNHDTTQIPLARSRRNNANSTMQMEHDGSGLAIRVNLDIDNNARAAELYSATKRGDITGMSFMFTVDADEWENLETEHPTRHVRKIGKVFEVSACTFPAYEQTSLEARSHSESLERAKEALEKANADAECEKLREEIRKML